MVTIKRVCRVHKAVRNKQLIPCETRVIKRKGEYIEYCPKCKKERTNYGIKTAIFIDDKIK